MATTDVSVHVKDDDILDVRTSESGLVVASFQSGQYGQKTSLFLRAEQAVELADRIAEALALAEGVTA